MQQLVLGDVSITRVLETNGPIMPTDAFFPTMPADTWVTDRELAVPDHLEESSGLVIVAMQSWLIRSAGRTVLVDTGVGNDKTRPAVEAWDHLDTDFLGTLAAAGVTAEDVDLVINTHLHVDHVGWNTVLRDDVWVPTFPNATYLMPLVDFEHWNPANNPSVIGGVNENVYEDSVAPVHAAGQVELWEQSLRIDENLSLEAAPGHTPGSSVVKLASGSDRALFAGDLMHSPLQVRHTEHNSCFCEDPQQARVTRERLLGWASDESALVMPAHFSGPGALTVEREDNHFAIKSWADFDRP